MSVDTVISIIVPVYNSVDYIENSVNSIIDDCDSDAEIILVDDGSTDGSSELCDQMAEANEIVRVIHKQNGGQSQARNIGMAEAHGKYVTFCDNDDIVLPGFVKDSLRIAQLNNADCLRFGCIAARVDASGHVYKATKNMPSHDKLYNSAEMATLIRDCDYGTSGVWTGIYKLEFLRNAGIRFHEGFRSGYEDTLFNDQVLMNAHSVVLNSAVRYLWIQRQGHSTSTYLSDNKFDSLKMLLSYEYEMFKSTDLIRTDKEWCGKVFQKHIRRYLSQNCFAPDRTFEKELSIYEAVRTVMLPYARLYDGRDVDGLSRLIMHSLYKRRYKLIYRLMPALSFGKRCLLKVRWGVSKKNVVPLATSVIDSLDDGI